MRKSILTIAFLSVLSFGMNAQVENRALNFAENGTVDCGRMPEMENSGSYSLQFWMNPSEWKEGAKLIQLGDFNAALGKTGSVVFNNGDQNLTVSDNSLKNGEWNQITLICDNGDATILVNGEEKSSGKLNSLNKTESSFVLGGGYNGLLDEVRVWNAALDENMKTFDYFTHNTLNKWCPMWDNLVAYYKMDQEKCPNLVEYTAIENPEKEYNNHGVMSAGVSRVSASNDKMPYLINSAYTNNDRFFDRLIPKDQYLLANDLIILGVDVDANTGHLYTKTPNNHAVPQVAAYLNTFEGREGVLSLDGKNGTRLVAPAATLNNGNQYGFETWLYLDEWTPGAYLFRKESADGKSGLSLRLGDDASNPTLIARVNGNEFVSQTMELPVKQWIHLGMAPGTGGSVIKALMFYVNGDSFRPDVEASTSSFDTAPAGNENEPLYIGEGLKGKLDETLFWNKNISLSDEKKHMTDVPMPSITKNVNGIEISNCSAYYKYDNKDDLGYSSHSQDEWLNIMKGAYDGHAGVNFFISVQGTYSGDWREVLKDADKRATFVKDLAEISKNYDGAELDLEWLESAAEWKNYFAFCDEIKAGLPEDKLFRVSTHQAYLDFIIPSAAKSEDYDGFTWQQYGPNANLFKYSSFKNSVNRMLSNGFDKKKIMTSYSTTTSKGSKGSAVIGVRGDALNNYEPATVDERDTDVFTNNADSWNYMGPMQVYARAKFTRENNLQGIFYWDMGNDNWNGTPADPEMPEFNLAKYCSYAINANNDLIVNEVTVKHYEGAGVTGIEVDADGPEEYYTLQGFKVENPEKGIFIKKKGNRVVKVIK